MWFLVISWLFMVGVSRPTPTLMAMILDFRGSIDSVVQFVVSLFSLKVSVVRVVFRRRSIRDVMGVATIIWFSLVAITAVFSARTTARCVKSLCSCCLRLLTE